MFFVIEAGSEAVGDRRAGQLGAMVENSEPLALPAARTQDTAVLGVLTGVLSATVHPPNLLL